jgi:hypothetical protein
LNIKSTFIKSIDIPKNTKKLLLPYNSILLNNLPEHIEKIHIRFSDLLKGKKININNLPTSLKEIIIKHKIYEKYIRIPFGAVLTIGKKNILYEY